MTFGENHSGWIRDAIREYETRLLSYAQRILNSRQAAEDVVQETFLRLCREEERQLNGRLAPWLYRVCRNKALDIKRKESRMATISEEQMSSGTSTLPSEAVELSEETDRVLSQIAQLPDPQQECLRLKFQEGLTYREISDVTGMSISNVGVTLHNAMASLRKRLS